VDLRKRLGMRGLPEATETLVELLNQREQDHINWLKELQASIHEGREFRLATDPHKCAFGKWYDSFKTSDTLLQFQLAKFDAPHKRIHSFAVQTANLIQQGHKDEAIRLVEDARDRELAVLIRLFADTRQHIQENIREIMLILEHAGRRIGFVVDSVTEVTDIQPGNIEPPPEIGNDDGGMIVGLAKIGPEVKILLDAVKLLETEEYEPLAELS